MQQPTNKQKCAGLRPQDHCAVVAGACQDGAWHDHQGACGACQAMDGQPLLGVLQPMPPEPDRRVGGGRRSPATWRRSDRHLPTDAVAASMTARFPKGAERRAAESPRLRLEDASGDVGLFSPPPAALSAVMAGRAGVGDCMPKTEYLETGRPTRSMRVRALSFALRAALRDLARPSACCPRAGSFGARRSEAGRGAAVTANGGRRTCLEPTPGRGRPRSRPPGMSKGASALHE